MAPMEPNGYTTTFNRLIKEMLADQPQDFLEKTSFGKGLTEEDRLRREQRERERAEREAEKRAGSEGAGKTIESRMKPGNRWGICNPNTGTITGTIYFYLDEGNTSLTLDTTDDKGSKIEGTFSQFIKAFENNVKALWGGMGYLVRRERTLEFNSDDIGPRSISVNVSEIRFLPLPSEFRYTPQPDTEKTRRLSVEQKRVLWANTLALQLNSTFKTSNFKADGSRYAENENPIGILIAGRGSGNNNTLQIPFIAEGNLTGYIHEQEFRGGRFTDLMPAHEFGHMLGLADRYFEGVAFNGSRNTGSLDLPIQRRNYPVVIPELEPLGYNYLSNLYSTLSPCLSQDQLEMVFSPRKMVEKPMIDFAIADSSGLVPLSNSINTTYTISRTLKDPDGLLPSGNSVLMYKNGAPFQRDSKLDAIYTYKNPLSKEAIANGEVPSELTLKGQAQASNVIVELNVSRWSWVLNFINLNRLYSGELRALKFLIFILFSQCYLYGQYVEYGNVNGNYYQPSIFHLNYNNHFDISDDCCNDSLISTRLDEKGRYIYAYSEADSLITATKDCRICFVFNNDLNYFNHYNEFKRAGCIRFFLGHRKKIRLSSYIQYLESGAAVKKTLKFDDKLVKDDQFEHLCIHGISVLPKFLERQTNLKVLDLGITQQVKEIKTMSKLKALRIVDCEDDGSGHQGYRLEYRKRYLNKNLNLNLDLSELKLLHIYEYNSTSNKSFLNMKKLEYLNAGVSFLKGNIGMFNAQNTPNLKHLTINEVLGISDVSMITKDNFQKLTFLEISCWKDTSKLKSFFSWVDTLKIIQHAFGSIDFRKKLDKYEEILLKELPNKDSNIEVSGLTIYFDGRDMDLKINIPYSHSSLYLNTGNYRNKKPINIEFGKDTDPYPIIITGKRKVNIDFDKYFEKHPDGILYLEYLDLYMEEIERISHYRTGRIIFRYYRGNKDRLIELIMGNGFDFAKESEKFEENREHLYW